MTVLVGPGTQATDGSLIEEEASRLPHRTLQRSFPLLRSCTSYGLARHRFVTEGWNQLIFYCHGRVRIYPARLTLPESTSQGHSVPSTGRGGGGLADSPRKCRGCCRFHQMSTPRCRAR